MVAVRIWAAGWDARVTPHRRLGRRDEASKDPLQHDDLFILSEGRKAASAQDGALRCLLSHPFPKEGKGWGTQIVVSDRKTPAQAALGTR